MGETPSIRVRLHRYADRPIGIIWRCGQLGGEVSSGTRDEREAWRAAGRLEEQLQAGQLPGRSDGLSITWADFRQRYELEWLESLSYGSQKGWKQAADHFETICNPSRLADVNKAMLSRFRGALEARGIAPTSVHSYYAALRAGLGWAESMDLIDRVPKIRQRLKAKSNATMRSRVITLEEFERMLAVVPQLRPRDHLALTRFMSGLWYSGLRIDELNRLHWSPSAPLHVDLTGSTKLLVFLGGQKNRADTFLPAPPEFWQLVEQRGWSRSGYVFALPGRFGNGRMTTSNIGKRIADCGRLAGVQIRDGKCATAHDLRAAYLTRVAARMTMSQTQTLARHSDPKTTSQFYVRHQAEELAEAMGW